MRRLSVAIAALLLLLACAAAAHADGITVAITQQLFGRDGNPWLVATVAPDGSLATPSWAICPQHAACKPAGVTNQAFQPGVVPADTRFKAIATYAGTTHHAFSSPWNGTVTSTAPPALTGVPRVGAVVTPHAGRWRGGWGRGIDLLHVEACRTADGRGCTTIAHPWAPRYGLRQPIDPRWSGRWLFAFDERFARDAVFPAVGYVSATGIPPVAVGPTVSRSTPLGPVSGPALRLREHPLLLRDGRLLVGRATCAHTCEVGLRVIAAGGHARTARLRVHGTRSLTVPAGDLGFEHGARIRVRIGTTPLVETFVGAGQVVAAAHGRP